MGTKYEPQPLVHQEHGRICCSLPGHAYSFPRLQPLPGPLNVTRMGLKCYWPPGTAQRGTSHTWCAAAFDWAGNSIKNENDEDFELWPGEMIPYAKIPADAFWCTPDATTHAAPACRPSSLEHLAEGISSTSAPGMTEAQLIYAVDDAPELTELYTVLLEATGYIVRAFNDRAKALTALTAERTKPDLLITDCVGTSMSVDRFVECCLVVHPTLRILMASGYSRTDVRFIQARRDRFIQKPFTAEEFLRRVRATLTT